MAADIGRINAMLNSNDKRYQGLTAIADLVCECSVDILVEQHKTWEKLLVQILQSHHGLVARQAAAYVMSVMLCRMAPYGELSRHAVSSTIPAVMSLTVGTEPEWLQSIGDCLLRFIPSFHGMLTSFAARVEALAVNLMQAQDNSSAVEKGAELLAILPACYPISKRAEVWSNVADRIIGSICNIVNEMCDCLGMEKRLTSKASIGFTVDEASGSMWGSRAVLNHLHALAHCWKHLLDVQCTLVANIPVGRFIEAIDVVFGVTPKHVLLKMTNDRLKLLTLLPSIHLSCCDMVLSLVMAVHGYLAPYANIISKWFTFLLTVWSVEQLPARLDKKVLTKLRPKVYSALKAWASTTGGNSLLDVHGGDVIRHILTDVEAALPKPTAGVSSKNSDADEIVSKQPPQKKHKKKANEYMASWQSTSAQIIPIVINEGDIAVCTSALDMLRQLITHVGVLLADEQYKKAVEGVLHTARYLVSFSWTEDVTVYRSDDCRVAVFCNLSAILSTAHPAGMQYISEITTLLLKGQRDPSDKVVDVCRTGLVGVENVIHPKGPPLSVPRTTSTLVTEKNISSSSVNYYGNLGQALQTSSITLQANSRDSASSFIGHQTLMQSTPVLLTESVNKQSSSLSGFVLSPNRQPSTVSTDRTALVDDFDTSSQRNGQATTGDMMDTTDTTQAPCTGDATAVIAPDVSYKSTHWGRGDVAPGALDTRVSLSTNIMPASTLTTSRDAVSGLASYRIMEGVTAAEPAGQVAQSDVSAEVADILKTFVDESPDSDDDITPVFT